MALKKTSKDLNEATLTRMQELGSAWVFKRAIQDNAATKWNSWESLKSDSDTFDEIDNIWYKVGGVYWDDNVDDEWLESFYKQQEALLDKIGSPKFTEFTRDGGQDGSPYRLPGSKPSGKTFMEWIEDYLQQEFKIGNKDNWNPADIWLIQDEEKWKKLIVNATKAPKRTKGSMKAQLSQLNQIFRILFRNKQIMGISLKKVGSGAAKFVEVNVTQSYFKKIEAAQMKLTGVRCYLGTKRINIKKDTNKRSDTFGQMIVDQKAEARSIRKNLGTTGYPTIETQDTVLTIEDTDNDVTYKVQIKNTSTTKMDNLKFEPTEKGKSSARMGKATRAFVFDIMQAYGILTKFPQTHQQYPKTKTAFNRTKMNAVEKQIKDIQTKCKSLGFTADMGDVIPSLSSVIGVINIKETMDRKGEAWTANSKLQQISFLNAILSLPKTGKGSVNDFCTDLIYLAAKQGRGGGFFGAGYGPFGKIY
jgi:hypothetical protein